MDLNFDPPVARTVSGPFVQTIQLMQDGAVVGTARWHSTGLDGVVQILDLIVAEKLQRVGNGRRLMQAVVQQANLMCAARGQKLRRMWIAVEQKSQIIGRAFLTGQGFHHVGTVEELLKRQDLLIYMRTFN